MSSNTGIEFMPLAGQLEHDVDASLLADTYTIEARSTATMKEPLLSSPPDTTPLSQRLRAHKPWRRQQPTCAWEWKDKYEFWGMLGQASVSTPPREGVAKELGHRFCDAARSQSKIVTTVVRKHPSVVLVPVLLGGLLVAMGCFGVRTAAHRSEDSARADAESAALKVSTALSIDLDRSILPVLTLAALIRETPSMAQLQPQFQLIAGELLAQAGPTAAAFQLELAPLGVVRAINPPLADLDSLGLNLFTDPSQRQEALWTLERRTVRLAGPRVVQPGNKQVLIARNPVFISGVGPNETWGNGGEGDIDCAACYDPANGTRFWGFAAAYVDLDSLAGADGSPLQLLQSRSYRFSLMKVVEGGSQASVRLAQSSPPPPSSGSVEVAVAVPGDSWQLSAYPEQGFRPRWEGPLIAVVVLFSAALTVVMFVALLNQRRLLMLMAARMPDKALRALSTGQPFYDHFSCVTVLDCQVVKYTSQEAGMEPTEVVKLLNDVYSLLDELVEGHQLHKVETFGDSYVAVGGCPEAGGRDSITWAAHVAHCARDMVIAAAKYRSPYGQRVQIQVGLHSGPLVSAVIDGGKRLPRYCLFGETLAVASEMCAASQPQAILVSRSTADLLAESGDPVVMLVPRGLTAVRSRNGAAMYTSWLQVDLMAGAYGGAYGRRHTSTDLRAHHGDNDEEVSLDGLNIVRKELPCRPHGARDSNDSECEPSLFGSFSQRLEAENWEVVRRVMGIQPLLDTSSASTARPADQTLAPQPRPAELIHMENLRASSSQQQLG